MSIVALPPTTKSFAAQHIVFIKSPAPVHASGVPTVAEVNAGTRSQGYIYGNFHIQPTQDSGAGPRKNGSRKVLTELGAVTYPAIEIQYSYGPQQAGTIGSVSNKLYELLTPGAVLTVAVFNGLDGETTETVATGAVADLFKITCGARRKGQTGDSEYDHMAITQTLVVEAVVKEDHAMTATIT